MTIQMISYTPWWYSMIEESEASDEDVPTEIVSCASNQEGDQFSAPDMVFVASDHEEHMQESSEQDPNEEKWLPPLLFEEVLKGQEIARRVMDDTPPRD